MEEHKGAEPMYFQLLKYCILVISIMVKIEIIKLGNVLSIVILSWFD